jgi:hypothetical protein
MDRVYGKSRNARWVGVKIRYQEQDENDKADEDEILEEYDDNIDENQL